MGCSKLKKSFSPLHVKVTMSLYEILLKAKFLLPPPETVTSKGETSKRNNSLQESDREVQRNVRIIYLENDCYIIGRRQ